MKKFIYPAIAITLFFASCDKTPDTPTPTPTPTTPTAPAAATPTPTNVDGALIAVQAKYKYEASIVPVDLLFETAIAAFYTSPGNSTTVNAGTVSVNSNTLDNNNNTYSKTALQAQTPDMLGFDNGNAAWSVSGSSSVASFSHSYSVSFPKYTGTLPTSVSKSGITISLGSNVNSADSVLVLVAAGNVNVIKTVGGNSASVTFSASELNSLPAVSDNTGIIEVCPYRYQIVNKNGKSYAFIKEQAVIGNVNIN